MSFISVTYIFFLVLLSLVKLVLLFRLTQHYKSDQKLHWQSCIPQSISLAQTVKNDLQKEACLYLVWFSNISHVYAAKKCSFATWNCHVYCNTPRHSLSSVVFRRALRNKSITIDSQRFCCNLFAFVDTLSCVFIQNLVPGDFGWIL